jgi:hypothetical protein
MRNRILTLPLLLGLSAVLPDASAQISNVPIPSPVGTLATVGSASIQVIGPNPPRRGIIFINLSRDKTITIVPDNQTAVAGQGVVIPPQGQQPFIGDGKLINYNCGWNAIADGGADNPLEILELL